MANGGYRSVWWRLTCPVRLYRRINDDDASVDVSEADDAPRSRRIVARPCLVVVTRPAVHYTKIVQGQGRDVQHPARQRGFAPRRPGGASV